MSTRKKRIAPFALATCMALLTFTFALTLPSNALAWDDCPKGLVNDPYPGACRRYVDTNGDDICDLSQPEPQMTTTTAEPVGEEVIQEKQSTTPTSVAVATVTTGEPPTGDCPLGPCAACGACLSIGAGIGTVASADGVAEIEESATLVSGTTGGDSGGFSLFTDYNVSPIAIGFFLIYGASFVLHKTKRIRLATHRKVWNVLLAATFLITGIFGLILTVQLDYELPFRIPFDLLFWHVEAGVAMTLISLFHLGWHFNYYKNLVRTGRKRLRAARAEEALRDADERRRAREARAARRATAAAGIQAEERRSQTKATREAAYRSPRVEPERARRQTRDAFGTEL